MFLLDSGGLLKEFGLKHLPGRRDRAACLSRRRLDQAPAGEPAGTAEEPHHLPRRPPTGSASPLIAFPDRQTIGDRWRGSGVPRASRLAFQGAGEHVAGARRSVPVTGLLEHGQGLAEMVARLVVRSPGLGYHP